MQDKVLEPINTYISFSPWVLIGNKLINASYPYLLFEKTTWQGDNKKLVQLWWTGIGKGDIIEYLSHCPQMGAATEYYSKTLLLFRLFWNWKQTNKNKEQQQQKTYTEQKVITITFMKNSTHPKRKVPGSFESPLLQSCVGSSRRMLSN